MTPRICKFENGLELIFQHGWSFDNTCWNSWEANLLNRALDPKFAGEPWRTPFSARIAVAHSLGLHLLPHEFFNADLIVLISSFLHFHPTEERARRLSKRLVERMLKKLDTEPNSVLEEFHKNCGLVPTPPVCDEPDVEQLKNDLRLLDTCNFNITLVPSNARILLLHGSDDSVVAIEKSRQMKEIFKNSTLIEIPNQGHGLPFSTPEISIDAMLQNVMQTLIPQTV